MFFFILLYVVAVYVVWTSAHINIWWTQELYVNFVCYIRMYHKNWNNMWEMRKSCSAALSHGCKSPPCVSSNFPLLVVKNWWQTLSKRPLQTTENLIFLLSSCLHFSTPFAHSTCSCNQERFAWVVRRVLARTSLFPAVQGTHGRLIAAQRQSTLLC